MSEMLKSEELELIAEAGDTADAKAMAARLLKTGFASDKQLAINIYRCVVRNEIDRPAMIALATRYAAEGRVQQAHAERVMAQATRFFRSAGFPV